MKKDLQIRRCHDILFIVFDAIIDVIVFDVHVVFIVLYTIIALFSDYAMSSLNFV